MLAIQGVGLKSRQQSLIEHCMALPLVLEIYQQTKQVIPVLMELASSWARKKMNKCNI